MVSWRPRQWTLRSDAETEPVDDEPQELAASTNGTRRSRRFSSSQQTFRWIHVYTSMISFIVVLFFGLTGITLNHPNWTLGSHPSHTTDTGTLPAGFAPNGTVNFLAVTEFVRATYGVSAPVSDYRADATQGTVGFKGPGYSAALAFDVATGSYTLSRDANGFVAVMNDIHKGRNTASSWNWVIDVSGGLLVFVSITGIGIQVFMKKRRRRAFIVAGIAGTLTIVAIYLTIS
jgi:uncharacterized protein